MTKPGPWSNEEGPFNAEGGDLMPEGGKHGEEECLLHRNGEKLPQDLRPYCQTETQRQSQHALLPTSSVFFYLVYFLFGLFFRFIFSFFSLSCLVVFSLYIHNVWQTLFNFWWICFFFLYLFLEDNVYPHVSLLFYCRFT